MSDDFRLLMIGAMYENGGNTTHRFLDGHPQLYVYPFESQVGTRLVTDELTSMFPQKYRWPTFALHATPEEDYRAIIDEEGKVRARTPHVSKFRHMPFDLSDDERAKLYVGHVRKTGRSRGSYSTRASPSSSSWAIAKASRARCTTSDCSLRLARTLSPPGRFRNSASSFIANFAIAAALRPRSRRSR